MARAKDSITKSFTFEGKRYYVTGKNETEAEVKKAMRLRDLEEGKVTVGGKMTVKEWAEKAVEIYKTNQADITREKYVQRMNHCIIEQIGSLQLKQVKPVHCQNVLNLQADKSKRQINEVEQTLRFIFQKALENNLILTNPAEHLTKPSGTKTTRRSISDTERSHLLKVAAKEDKYILFLLMLQCSCRPSEARECKGMDIKLIEEQPVLHIRGTKTVNADRMVPMPEDLYQRVKNTPKFDYICPNEFGNKHNQKSYYRLCKSLYRALNISMGCKVYRNALVPPYPLADDFVPYDLRHTYCTDLQKMGVDIRTAQYLMGHADIRMTANIYTHADNSTILAAAKLINGTTPGTTLNSIKMHQKAE